ncbi:MAG: hypothetical protein KDB03_11700 [Planctomycetales bacterium]|nr:hypothetical protein [Planctomycetales bacterium]
MNQPSDHRPRWSNESNVPDLYHLLRLTGPDASDDEIQSALRRLKAELARQSKSESAAKLSRLLKLATANLSNPKVRAKYDAQWRSAYEAVEPNAAFTQKSVHKTAGTLPQEFLALLPKGDALKTFDLAKFVKGTTANSSRLEADQREYAELMAAISDNRAVRPQVGGLAVEIVAESSGPPPVNPSPLTRPRLGSQETPSILAKRMRRRREQNMWISVVGFLISLGIVFGVTYYLVQRSQKQVAQSADANFENFTQEPAPPSQASGLPQVIGLEPDVDVFNSNPAELIDGNATMAESADGQDSEALPQPAPELLPPSTTIQPTETPAPTLSPEKEMVATAELTEAQKQAWEQALSIVREQLGNQQYASIDWQALRSQASLPSQTADLERLERLGKLAADLQSTLVDAIRGRAGGETFHVGATQLGFVESNEGSITLKVSGGNQRFLLTQLPVGIALALTDMANRAPLGDYQAQQAAFILFHPARNQLALRRAQGLIREAVALGAVSDDLLREFEVTQ